MPVSANPAPPVIMPARRGWQSWACGMAVLVAVMTVIFLYDPAQHGFYPRCALKASTGFDCPGCGGLRAAHQLLHGQVRAAFVLNPLLVVSLPFAGWKLLQKILRTTVSRHLPPVVIPPVLIWLGVAALIAFGVLRNLPVFTPSNLVR